MTSRDVILLGWLVVAAGLYVWLWRQVKKVDDAQDEADAQTDALIEEMESFNRKADKEKARSLSLLDDEQNREWEGNPFSLDENEQPHPPRAA